MTVRLPGLRRERALLWVAISVDVVLWAGVSIFTYSFFGGRCAVGITLVVMLPLLAALTIFRRRRNAFRRDVGYILVAMIVSYLACGWIIWTWFDTGMHMQHAADLRYAAFQKDLRNDPAFDGVTLSVEGYHVLWINGSAKSKRDYERLRELANQHHIPWNERLRISPDNRERGKGARNR